MHEYYVYILRDPRNRNEPFYIGKGTGRRTKVHFNESRKHENPRKWAKIMAIQNAGFDVVIETYASNLTQEESLNVEEKLICQYGRLDLDEGGILTNRRKRGVLRKEGWQPYKRQRRPRTAPAWNKGLTKADPRVAANSQAISEAKIGKPLSEEHKAALRLARAKK